MIFQLLTVVVAVLGTALCWPISLLDDYVRVTKIPLKVTCGDDREIPLETTEYLALTFSTSQQDLQDDTPCIIHLRVDVKDRLIAKYGTYVAGMVDFGNATSDPQCSSSYLSVADEDDDDDEMGHKTRYCGKENVIFQTREDMINVQIYVKDPKQEKVHITLDIKPHYLCGGVVAEEKDITSPDFPNNYDKDFVCLWQVKAPEGHGIKLQFSEFELQPMKNNECKDYLAINIVNRKCGTKLANTTITISQSSVLLHFNSGNKKRLQYKGFSCSINFFKLLNKDSLMLKFFS